MTINAYGRLRTDRGEQGEHVQKLSPKMWGKSEPPAGNLAVATPPADAPNAENQLAKAAVEVAGNETAQDEAADEAAAAAEALAAKEAADAAKAKEEAAAAKAQKAAASKEAKAAKAEGNTDDSEA